jgi:hypothetical protein
LLLLLGGWSSVGSIGTTCVLTIRRSHARSRRGGIDRSCGNILSIGISGSYGNLRLLCGRRLGCRWRSHIVICRCIGRNRCSGVRLWRGSRIKCRENRRKVRIAKKYDAQSSEYCQFGLLDELTHRTIIQGNFSLPTLIHKSRRSSIEMRALGGCSFVFKILMNIFEKS